MKQGFRWGLILTRIITTAGLVSWVVYHLDGAHLANILTLAPPWIFSAPTLILLLNSSLHATRIRLLLPQPVPWRDTLRAVLIGNFFGLILPTGGGEAIKLGALQRLSGGLVGAATALGTSRLLELIPWALLLIWGTFGILPSQADFLLPVAAGAAALFMAVLGAVWGGARVPIPRLLTLQHAVHAIPPRKLLLCGLLAFPFAFNNALIVFLIAHALHVDLPLAHALQLIPAADVLISLPITISGIGIRESVFVPVLEPYGAAPTLAVAIATIRWTGELGRSLVGGLIFLRSGYPSAARQPCETTDQSLS